MGQMTTKLANIVQAFYCLLSRPHLSVGSLESAIFVTTALPVKVCDNGAQTWGQCVQVGWLQGMLVRSGMISFGSEGSWCSVEPTFWWPRGHVVQLLCSVKVGGMGKKSCLVWVSSSSLEKLTFCDCCRRPHLNAVFGTEAPKGPFS